MNGYQFHPEALRDLDEVWEYIAADNLPAADRVIGEILDCVRALVRFPSQGHSRPDLTDRPLRFLAIREYLIAYAPEERPLWVLAVLHGKRNVQILAAILRNRR